MLYELELLGVFTVMQLIVATVDKVFTFIFS